MGTRTKTQDYMVSALGSRRQQLAAQIKELQNGPTLVDLQAEMVEVEANLKSIDPDIPDIDAVAAEAVPALK